MTCPACAITLQMGRGPCDEHTPANPWAGRHPCPTCASSAWTLPAEVYVPGTWRCVSDGTSFTPASAVAA